MKKSLSVVLALVLSAGILLYVSADVNEGHGPDYVATEEEAGQH